MSKKPFYSLIIIPMIIYVFFAIPSLKELSSADSTPFLMAADQISGIRQWVNSPYISQNGLWHPPLYVIILSMIRKLFGTNIIFFRLFGLSCCLVSIIFIYLISDEVQRDKQNYIIPLLASLIFSINPLVIRGSLHIDIDNTLLTTLMLAFIFLFLKKSKRLNTANNIIQLTFISTLLLSTKFTTPPLLAFAIFLYLLINKKVKECILIIKIFLLGFIFFNIFFMLYALKMHYPPLILFKTFSMGASFFMHRVIYNLKFIYDIFRNVIWFSPFFLLLWLYKITNRLYGFFQHDILYDREDLLIIISIIIYTFYLLIVPVGHSFPKYFFPIISIMSILIAGIIARDRQDIFFDKKTFIIIVGIALIYNIVFIGDLPYLVNYVVKERFIKSNFNTIVLYKESFNIILKLCLLFALSLVIFIFYHKIRRQKFISAVIATSFLMFISSFLALDIIQYKAKYQVIYTYGKEGTKDLLRFLKARITSGDIIIAPDEIVYYLDATNSGFVVANDDLATPEKFISILKDKKPTYIVYGIASNTIKQYKDVFSSKLLFDYFQFYHFKSMNIGSYTLWIKTDKKDSRI